MMLKFLDFYFRRIMAVALTFTYLLMVFMFVQTNNVSAVTGTAIPKAKNVIMIQTDHELFYQHGSDNDTFNVHRPYYDEFLEESVEFVNARSINPLCSPARRSMITAAYPHQHGITTNHTDIFPSVEVPTIYDMMLENNFSANNTYFYGKTHWGGGTENDTPTTAYNAQGWSISHYGNPYTQQRYKDYVAELKSDPSFVGKYTGVYDLTYNNPVMNLELESLTPGKQQPGYEYNLATNGIITGNHFGIAKTPKEYHEAYFLANLAREQLRELAENDSDEPFVMTVNIWGPHHPYYANEEFVELYRDENGVLGGNFEEYPSFADDFINKPTVYAWDNSVGSNPSLAVPNTKTWEQFSKYMALAYAQTTLVDEAIGTILQEIKDCGFWDDTTIIWTTDHGDALGSHGGHADKECYLTEEILAIPMAVRYPNFPESFGTKNYAYVNTADVPVTMLDAIGLSFDRRVTGMSILDLISGEQKPREYMVVETNGHFSDTRARALYYDGYKYSYYMGDIDELYDLENDPFEMTNLIFEPTMKGRITMMKNMMREWQIIEKDTIPLVNI